jgi:hypothetical protein
MVRKRTGSPPNVWLHLFKYLADVHNYTSDETLDNDTPYKRRYGETPDISMLLQFKFYEPVYYLDPTQPFPGTKEKTAYWLGLADNVGDHLFYYLLTTDTRRIIARSVIRSAIKDPSENVEAIFPQDEYTPNFDQLGDPELGLPNEEEGSVWASTPHNEFIRDTAEAIRQRR